MVGSIVRVSVGLLVAAGTLALAPRDANAVMRWQSDGTICNPWQDKAHQTFLADAAGMKLMVGNSGFMRAHCPILVGPSFVELSEASAHTLFNVFLHMRFNSWNAASQRVITVLYVHDIASDSVCICDYKSFVQAPGFFARALWWDGISINCQSCTTDSGWQAVVEVEVRGTMDPQFGFQDTLQIKRIGVYDDT
jgi:hypothetical protein